MRFFRLLIVLAIAFPFANLSAQNTTETSENEQITARQYAEVNHHSEVIKLLEPDLQPSSAEPN